MQEKRNRPAGIAPRDLNAPMGSIRPLMANPEGTQGTLRDVVKHALLQILADPEASAAAKASAGRTLMQYFSEDNQGLGRRRGADMTAAELDAAIAELD
ncbi:hypothetical protein EHM76_04650 [bacterium]|nr:MAG: hypothetical protein EHM76_04650 [bacterium]